MRKEVEERIITTLIENGVKLRHRSMFVIVGDKSRDQMVNLHHILSKSVTKSNTNVLWCSKNNLDTSSHNKNRAMEDRGQLDPGKPDALSHFLDGVKVTHCMYKDSERILGKTFGMCILQDFEALTPNLLAQTIETVEGGGLVVVLLQSLSSLTSLYTMDMDVHDSFRTESHSEISGRFNERFLLSLASCNACVVMDDEWNILPLSSHIRSITQVPTNENQEGLSKAEQELKRSTDAPNAKSPVDPLINMCCTLDQREAVVTICDLIMDKNIRCIVELTASRGRGKSAALGLAVAGAVAAGYSSIYVTAPSPDDLKTLFKFVCKGFKALKYKKQVEYDVETDFKQAIVRINIFKQHKQTIQYINPHEHEGLPQVELLVIDEGAAIPLQVLKGLLLLSSYRVFLSSTVTGYEATGGSLSVKLREQLQEQCKASVRGQGSLSGCLLKEIKLLESVRYASKDPIESWLNNLLCLDVSDCLPTLPRKNHPLKNCDLYYVNRDALFSYNKESELFLQQMMALCVSSHYKNSPNDLQLLADDPALHLFVLLGHADESKNDLGDMLCVVQVCFEGKISHNSATNSLTDGHSPHGDQIPWKFCEQFQNSAFPTYSGARIVNIAVHPNVATKPYGSAAVDRLTSYFESQLASVSEGDDKFKVEASPVRVTEAAKKTSLLEEQIKPRASPLKLRVPLNNRQPEKLDYLGVSFGLTLDLFRFWRKFFFAPFYISQIPSAVTGEHTCMLLKPLIKGASKSNELGFLAPFYKDFRIRFSNLLSNKFKKMDYELAMSVLDPKIKFQQVSSSGNSPDGFLKKLDGVYSLSYMERLRAYTDNRVDFNLVYDLYKRLAHQYFQERIPVSLSEVQASVLLCLGLQDLELSSIERRMPFDSGEIQSILLEVGKKLYLYLHEIATKETSTLPRLEPRNVSGLKEQMRAEAVQNSNISSSGNSEVNPSGSDKAAGKSDTRKSDEVVERRTSSRLRRPNPTYHSGSSKKKGRN